MINANLDRDKFVAERMQTGDEGCPGEREVLLSGNRYVVVRRIFFRIKG